MTLSMSFGGGGSVEILVVFDFKWWSKRFMDIGVDSGALLIHVFIILFVIKSFFADSENNE